MIPVAHASLGAWKLLGVLEAAVIVGDSDEDGYQGARALLSNAHWGGMSWSNVKVDFDVQLTCLSLLVTINTEPMNNLVLPTNATQQYSDI